MGVTYKLKDEVVQFIISQRQGNPLSSCRQLAESASAKFGVHLSKSSVHDVLKESGIISTRGRKPKNKFEIPQEKKKQIQDNLSQVKSLLPKDIQVPEVPLEPVKLEEPVVLETKEQVQEAEVYEGVGKIFQKAVLWDLGVFDMAPLKEADWDYYLTYTKGIKVELQDGRPIFIKMVLPIERCIREVTDGLVNNIRLLIVDEVSDEFLFKAVMEAQEGVIIQKISIVGQNDHEIINFNDVVVFKRQFIFKNRIFMENYRRNWMERLKTLFFPEIFDNNNFIESLFNSKGSDAINKGEIEVTLLFDESYGNKEMIQEAIDKVNGMCLYDDEARLLKLFLKG